MIQVIKCNLCGSEIQRVVYKNLVVCYSCGLGFLSPRMSKEGYSQYYREEYDRTKFRTKVPEELKLAFFERVLPFISSMEVLDVGAGGGEYLLLFSGNKTAIEPSPEMRKKLSMNGITCFPSIDDVDQEFDFVVLRHTLEHFLDPLSDLRKIRKVMKSDSKIYVAVPNSLPINRGRDWFRVAHTYYFNSYTLASMLSLAGFSIDWMDSDREELFCIATKAENPIAVPTPDWLPSYQFNCLRRALKYRTNRFFRIKTKICNFFRSL